MVAVAWRYHLQTWKLNVVFGQLHVMTCFITKSLLQIHFTLICCLLSQCPLSRSHFPPDEYPTNHLVPILRGDQFSLGWCCVFLWCTLLVTISSLSDSSRIAGVLEWSAHHQLGLTGFLKHGWVRHFVLFGLPNWHPSHRFSLSVGYYPYKSKSYPVFFITTTLSFGGLVMESGLVNWWE